MNGFKKELTENILPFWAKKMTDHENGGFYGRIDGNGKLHRHANKGAVLHARILWTFSAAYRILGDETYKKTAVQAYEYLKTYFIDPIHGGVFWEVDYLGLPTNRKKQLYAQGFALYGFSEYYRATHITEALALSKSCYHWIEKTVDTEHGGYFEAFTQDWKPIADMRLSSKDANEKKSMNTHLHILEPYTNLYRIWPDANVKKSLYQLIKLFNNHIIDKNTAHLHLFFDEKWSTKSSAVSFGHDIEAAWLLVEAVETLKDEILLSQIKQQSLAITEAALEGWQADNSLAYERDGEYYDTERHWWVQAEAVVGLMYAYSHSKTEKHYIKATKIWQYIQQQLIDKKQGEWFWSIQSDGSINHNDDKAGFWKCPYHNSRMCFEMIETFKLS